MVVFGSDKEVYIVTSLDLNNIKLNEKRREICAYKKTSYKLIKKHLFKLTIHIF